MTKTYSQIVPLTLLAVALTGTGCAAGSASRDEADTLTSQDSDSDPLSLDEQAAMADAFEELLKVAPPACVDFCQFRVACDLGYSDVTGSQDDLSAVAKRLNEICILDCTYPMQGGTTLFFENDSSGNKEIEGFVSGTLYTEVFQCVTGLDAFECFERVYRLNIEDDQTCLDLEGCLGKIETLAPNCARISDGSGLICRCQIDATVSELATLLGEII